MYSAVSGLKTHQTRMDVIGNNIANVNTVGYKSQSVQFAELLYQTTSNASGPNATAGTGGVNAKQIGLGVKTGAISTEPENHNEMSHLRYEKVAKIEVPDLKVEGDADDADLLIVGFGSTYGHLLSTMKVLREKGHKVALAQFKYINPLPANTAEVLMKYKKVVVAEQNLGQLAALLRIRINGFTPYQFDQVKGQPFVVNELVSQFEKLILVREELKPTSTFDERML